ncbi:hypothetical protein [Kineococcus rhizosphaerae]|uniref:Uncharacterized protein n=1 Tax=Kineococcus rhizosphaerae TaxID=559628 RepID=A0A2T0R6H8_9ACTN|nr:hypothetical protein [Kineococcus rhizosphaerae]PRY16757.1 hypothetical protein CLV37_103188 [Kineococcus rhizosphaerae]
MNTADRAQDDLNAAAAAVAAARPEPFPRWVAPAMVIPYVGGFAALAVSSWAGSVAGVCVGVGLLLVFFVVFFTAVLRQRVRTKPARTRAQNLTDFGAIAVCLLVSAFWDPGFGLVLLGALFAVPLWRQVSRQGRS